MFISPSGLTKIKDILFSSKKLRSKALKLFKFQNYSPTIANSPFITELFDKLIHDDKKKIKRISKIMFDYGRYQYLEKKLTEYKKEFGHEQWFKQKECRLLTLKNEYEKAKTCLEKVKEPWARFRLIYNSFLKGEDIKDKNIEEFSASMADKKGFWVFFSKIFFLKNRTKENTSELNLDEIIKKYEKGYLLLALNKRYQIIEDKLLEKLMEKYRERFKGSLFTQVLKNQVDPEKLSRYFGKNSLYYQVHIN